ncbi:nucleoside 2-deoxyribosyltransferase [Dechloromonas sp. ZY10]|uniref:nucleoside 2-deoxyribosyltransferase n=1 Tax=Dechloromonas aquae TaxID=2664436 RepID=UPI00352943A4
MAELPAVPVPDRPLPGVYLAGPDVFFPDIAARAAVQKALCGELGLRPLHPVDQPELQAETIYRHNLALIREAAGVVANLDPFRGAEVDSGTAFEVGYAIALGKPVVAYFSVNEDWRQRVERCQGPLHFDPSRAVWCDADGNLVENFGLPANLMLAIPCTVVVGDAGTALRRLRDLLQPGCSGCE